jgi:hypothetical protein
VNDWLGAEGETSHSLLSFFARKKSIISKKKGEI